MPADPLCSDNGADRTLDVVVPVASGVKRVLADERVPDLHRWSAPLKKALERAGWTGAGVVESTLPGSAERWITLTAVRPEAQPMNRNY